MKLKIRNGKSIYRCVCISPEEAVVIVAFFLRKEFNRGQTVFSSFHVVGLRLTKVALMVISLVEEAEDPTDSQLEAEIKAKY